VAWLCDAGPVVVMLAHCVTVWLTLAVPFPFELNWVMLAACEPVWLCSDVGSEGGEHALGPCSAVCVTVALSAPEPLVCWITQVWLTVPADVVDDCSVQVALFEPDVEIWTIVHVWDDPSLLELLVPPAHETELDPPAAVVNWRTWCDLVQVHPLPGHFGPA
jgi:hypothetical protein